MSALQALVALARLRLLPFVLMLPGLGFGWAHWDHALPATGVQAFLGVLLAWTWLHVGTLWLNAALDRDEGEVLLGVAVPPPAGVERAGHAALVLAVTVGALVSPAVGGITVAAALLAVAYSHPALAWKGHPWLGPATNVVGYGLLSPLAGWWVVGTTAGLRAALVALVVMAGIGGSYLAAQVWQGDEDRARGYRTLVAVAGPAATLIAVRLCFGLAFGGAVCLAAAGWIPELLLVVLVPGAWWVDAWVRAWSALPSGGGPVQATGLARRIAVVLVAAVLVASVVYVRDSFTGGPVAGLATSGGHPPRVVPAPAVADRLEARQSLR